MKTFFAVLAAGLIVAAAHFYLGAYSRQKVGDWEVYAAFLVKEGRMAAGDLAMAEQPKKAKAAAKAALLLKQIDEHAANKPLGASAYELNDQRQFLARLLEANRN